MERISRFRARILILLVLLLIGFYVLKLLDLQIISNDGSATNISTFTTKTHVKAARGDILDRNGNVLVGNRASYNMTINHFVLNSTPSPNAELKALVELCDELGIKYNEHFPVSMTRPYVYTLDQYSSAWQEYFRTYLHEQGELDSDITAPLLMEKLRKDYEIPSDWTDELARKVIGLHYELRLRVVTNLPVYVFIEDVDDATLSALLELNVPGMNVEASTVREYHTKYAAHILGYTGKMSPEQWEEYKDLGYSMDAEVGQSGFELAFEEQLHGTDAWRVDEVTTDGTIIKSYYEDDQPPKAGNNVEVTIDIGLQGIAEEALADRFKELRSNTEEKAHGKDAEGGAAVAMDPTTGEVLVCASYPTYDPGRLLEDWDDILKMPYDAMFNRALNATYPPGSTFKPCMVVAGINSGYMDSTKVIEDKGVFTEYDGFAPMCLLYSGYGYTHGSINAAQALMHSCNYFFYVIGDEMSLDAMTETAKGFGLGEHTGIELPEAIGHRSNREEKAKLYPGDAGEWNQGDKVLTAIGQAENSYSPMQLCVYASTLAERGTRYKATFLSRVVSSDYRNLVFQNSKKVESTMKIIDDAYKAYMEGMYMVAHEHDGTASDYFEGVSYHVCAKTGTSQHGMPKASDHGAFICFAPSEDPEIAISVFGEKAGSGGAMAPVARKMLDYYFANQEGEASEVPIYEYIPG